MNIRLYRGKIYRDVKNIYCGDSFIQFISEGASENIPLYEVERIYENSSREFNGNPIQDMNWSRKLRKLDDALLLED